MRTFKEAKKSPHIHESTWQPEYEKKGLLQVYAFIRINDKAGLRVCGVSCMSYERKKIR